MIPCARRASKKGKRGEKEENEKRKVSEREREREREKRHSFLKKRRITTM